MQLEKCDSETRDEQAERLLKPMKFSMSAFFHQECITRGIDPAPSTSRQAITDDLQAKYNEASTAALRSWISLQNMTSRSDNA